MQTCFSQSTNVSDNLISPNTLGGHFLGLTNPVRDVGAGGGDLPLHILTPDGEFLHRFFGKSPQINVDIRPVILIGGHLDVTLEIPGVQSGQWKSVAEN